MGLGCLIQIIVFAIAYCFVSASVKAIIAGVKAIIGN